MLEAPGPMEVVQAIIWRRFLALAKATAASAMPCSLWARNVGSVSRAWYRASPNPATLPWPKMPQQPANSGTSAPSMSERWAARYRTTAWAAVSRIVFSIAFSSTVSCVTWSVDAVPWPIIDAPPGSAVEADDLTGAQRFQGGIGEAKRFAALGEACQRCFPLFDAIDEVVDLGHVGFEVALDEEVQDGVTGFRHIGAPGFHGRRTAVLGLKHALLAEGFDPLVIAVAAAPAVVDVNQSAGSGPQGDHRGVDIANFLDTWIDQVAAHGLDLDDVTGQITRHVEVVDGHVAEQATGAFDVLGRRRGGVAAGDDDLLQLAQFSTLDAVAQRLEGGVEAAVEADHDQGVELADLVSAGFDAGDIQVDRLLA